MIGPYSIPYTPLGSMFSTFQSEPVYEPSNSIQYYMSGGSTEHIFAGYNAELEYMPYGVGLFDQTDPSMTEERTPDLNVSTTKDNPDPQYFLVSRPQQGRLRVPHERRHLGCGTGDHH